MPALRVPGAAVVVRMLLEAAAAREMRLERLAEEVLHVWLIEQRCDHHRRPQEPSGVPDGEEAE